MELALHFPLFPLLTSFNVIIEKLSKPVDNPGPQDAKQYQKLVGQPLYCQQITVSEITLNDTSTVCFLSRYIEKAGPSHLQLGKKILCYFCKEIMYESKKVKIFTSVL